MPNLEILSKALTQDELMEYSQLIAEPKLNPTRLRGLMYKISHYPPPSWEEYYGCNHKPILTNSRYGGMVSVARHIGRPLSTGLWEDLVHRLGISRLWVLKYNQERWCMDSQCVVILDENNYVKDIEFGARFN